ncbi:hypothetical protein HDU97_008592 [Phlyctochytrium planicorne]|nr:hypothetical protein HDU97_008592 [Phlyctochytrium planicorne]
MDATLPQSRQHTTRLPPLAKSPDPIERRQSNASASDPVEKAFTLKRKATFGRNGQLVEPDVPEGELLLTGEVEVLNRKKTFNSASSFGIGGQRRGESIIRIISQNVPKTVREGGLHHHTKLTPIFSLSKLNKWTLRFQDRKVENEFILFYNQKFSKVNSLLAIAVAVEYLFQGICFGICIFGAVVLQISSQKWKTMERAMRYHHFVCFFVTSSLMINYFLANKKITDPDQVNDGFQSYVEYMCVVVIFGSVSASMQTFLLSSFQIWTILGNYVALNLAIKGSHPKNFLTPLTLYTTTYLACLYTSYTRELRLRLMFLMEHDLSTTFLIPHDAVSHSATDDLHNVYKTWSRGLPIDASMLERKKAVKEKLKGLAWWRNVVEVERLRNDGMEERFLGWQHEGILWIFRMEMGTVALNEAMHAFVDAIAYCDATDNMPTSQIFCFESGITIRNFRLAYFLSLGAVFVGVVSLLGLWKRDGKVEDEDLTKGETVKTVEEEGGGSASGGKGEVDDGVVGLGLTAVEMAKRKEKDARWRDAVRALVALARPRTTTADPPEEKVFVSSFLSTVIFFSTSYSVRLKELLAFGFTIIGFLLLFLGSLGMGTVLSLGLSTIILLILLGAFSHGSEVEILYVNVYGFYLVSTFFFPFSSTISWHQKEERVNLSIPQKKEITPRLDLQNRFLSMWIGNVMPLCIDDHTMPSHRQKLPTISSVHAFDVDGGVEVDRSMMNVIGDAAVSVGGVERGGTLRSDVERNGALRSDGERNGTMRSAGMERSSTLRSGIERNGSLISAASHAALGSNTRLENTLADSKKHGFHPMVSDLGGQKRGETIIKLIAQNVPQTVREGGFHPCKPLPVLSRSKLNKWTLRFQDGKVENEFILFYNRKFARVNEALGSVVGVLTIHPPPLVVTHFKTTEYINQGICCLICTTMALLVRMIRKTPSLTSLMRYTHFLSFIATTSLMLNYFLADEVSNSQKLYDGYQSYVQVSGITERYLTCLYTTYTRELRLRLIFLLEHDLSTTLSMPHTQLSILPTDTLYSLYLSWAKLPLDPSADPKTWCSSMDVERLKQKHLEDRFLEWQHDGVIFLFGVQVVKVCGNEFLRAFLDAMA